jgi:2-oxoglutarate dehydrogenase E1 component
MDKFSYLNNANGAFVDDLYQKYQADPSSVDSGWKKFFEGFEFASQNGVVGSAAPVSSKEVSVVKLINAYRERGHLIAKTNPVRDRRIHETGLSPEYYDLSEADFDTTFAVGAEIGIGSATLREIITHLQKTYCNSIGVEFRQIRNAEIRQWLYKEMEPGAIDPKFDKAKKKHILSKINNAVNFESFLHTKFVGQKRFSLEGIEALIPAMDAAIEQGAFMGAEEFVIGMAHRGRLNMLVNIFGKSPENVFSEFSGTSLPDEVEGDGDVKYHLGRSADIITNNGKKVHLSLLPNPSHLEAVNPVVLGVVRAKAIQLYNEDFRKIVPILIHGDAALSGQGIIYECANFYQLEGYSTGGTIHIVLNNQVGFTANYEETRSSIYCTDIAKMMEAPVFHVNADDPEAVTHVMEMAIKLREQFAVDVIVDILGYRKYGHNEGDEPKFTQPMLYENISKHKNVFEVYTAKLVAEQTINAADAKQMMTTFKSFLQSKFETSKKHKKLIEVNYLNRLWRGLRPAKEGDFEQSPETGIARKTLDLIAKELIHVPKDFNLFAKMQRLLNQRDTIYFTEGKVDWGMAELLAYGSILLQGLHVRISGQDSQRGTFSHRHAVIKDEKNERKHVPLNNLKSDQGKFTVYNSHLSEYGVLGFEYGYSLAKPKGLTIWEAQFGDFANGAQIIFDQFISSAESKWQRMSGLTVFLPHGFEGQGPEHSSARLERYLQLCGHNNMFVVNPTTPANFFHLLRRQVNLEFRKPLIVMTPKSGLRHPLVISDIKELEKGRFEEVLDDTKIKVKDVTRVIVCSGKVYYDLIQERDAKKKMTVAIVRLEQLYPLSTTALDKLKSRYKNVKDWVWVQEEPENMGAWAFIFRRLNHFNFRYIGRKESSSPATGSSAKHEQEQANIINEAINA